MLCRKQNTDCLGVGYIGTLEDDLIEGFQRRRDGIWLCLFVSNGWSVDAGDGSLDSTAKIDSIACFSYSQKRDVDASQRPDCLVL